MHFLESDFINFLKSPFISNHLIFLKSHPFFETASLTSNSGQLYEIKLKRCWIEDALGQVPNLQFLRPKLYL